MSIFTRRALQLYDKENNSLSLNEPQTIYAETHIVQESNPHLLDIGEHYSVNRNLIDKYAVASTKLSAAELGAWQPYADNATFALDNINVVGAQPSANQPASPNKQNQSSNNPKPNETNSTEKKPSDDSAKQQSNAKNDNGGEQKTTGNSKSAPWYWWLVGAGTLGVLYYILGERGKNRESE
jgi:hypothetical protein